MNEKNLVSVSEALKFGFSEFIEHFFLFLKIMLIKFGIYSIVGLLSFGIARFFFYVNFKQILSKNVQEIFIQVIHASRDILQTFTMKQVELFHPLLLLIGIGVILFLSLLNIIRVFLRLGMVRIALDIYHKDTSTLSQLFSQSSKILPAWFASILYGIICILGCLFFIIPGIFFIVMFSLYEYAIVDQNKGVIASLWESYCLVSKHKMSVFILVCILFLIYLVSGPIGLLLMAPVGKLTYAFVYTQLKGSEQGPEMYAVYDM